MKKKIFLGAYLNYTNAQNLNCLSLARYLDKERFDIYALTTQFGDNNIEDISIKLFHCFSPFVFTKYIGFIWGILNCEILYLPKHREMPVWVLKFANLLSKKIFTTIEGNMCDTTKRSMIDSFNGVKNMQNYFSLIPNIYGITKHIIQNAKCGVKLNNNPLYLGVEKADFISSKKKRLQNIVFIGNLGRNKRIKEFFKLANIFLNLNFHVIGNKKYIKISKKRRANLKDKWKNKGNKNEKIEFSDNIILHGKINREDLPEKLKEIDLLFLPSRSEGFPKVILEAAASAIPSIVYHDYGASEWITTNKNGFVVNSFNDVKDKINQIINNPDLLQNNSKEALNLSEKFDWKNLIKNWEEVIDNL